jgi:formyltetrahydrofolate deformylase
MTRPTAILLLHCPDQQGIITEVTKFITDNKGNIVYLDQYVDTLEKRLFMRIEWELDSFSIPRDRIKQAVDALKAAGFNAEGHVSEGTAHEFLTWRRALRQMSLSLFK